MMKIEGEMHPTIADAAAEFGVSARAVRDWISKGIIPPPPTMEQGIRSVDVFPGDYMRLARKHLQRHRAASRGRRRGVKGGDS